jgi:CheY-like chemotaxis protein
VPGLILIVEDNETNALILRAMLKRRGYETAVAVDGAEGVEMTLQMKPRLILMDLHMPRLDGFASAAAVRQASGPETGWTPVIVAVTANASPEVHAACLASGFDAVLSKPLMLDALLSTIQSFFPSA